MSNVKFYICVMSTSKYGEGIPDLDGVDNSILELQKAINFQNADTRFISNAPFSKAVDDISQYIQSISGNKKNEKDVFLFFFCGHGHLNAKGDSLRFGTTDTSQINYTEIGVECNFVASKIKQHFTNYFMILDCCHSGLVTSMGDDVSIDQIADKLSKGGGVYVTSTSKSAQTAKEINIDGKKYAAFTHYFSQALLNGIPNTKKYISIGDLVNLTDALMHQSVQHASLPSPKIKCENELNTLEIFLNRAAIGHSAHSSRVRKERIIPNEEREKIIPPPSRDSELVFGLVGAFGTSLKEVSGQLKELLKEYGYCDTEEISISQSILLDKDIQKSFLDQDDYYQSEECKGKNAAYKRARYLMELGTEIRYQMGNDFLAMSVVNLIARKRHEAAINLGKEGQVNRPKHAYIIRSLKHPNEVSLLRDVYGSGFYLFGIYEDAKQRRNNMRRKLTDDDADELMATDEKEGFEYGQQARKTYQTADFFINYTDKGQGKVSIHRILDLIFGHPFITPTFGEYAMFLAWSSSLRSADLSRQIGAVVCKNNEVLTTGANDCPAGGGGLYWLKYDSKEKKYSDMDQGRDYTRHRDTNKAEFVNIVKDLFSTFNISETPDNFRLIRNSALGNLTEYGRVVHAEMEAILSCSRNNISCRGADMYVTTFPCHNCAKHIIAAGFRKVVYIEAYPKSKTIEFYKESISSDEYNTRQSTGDIDNPTGDIDNPIDTIDNPKVIFSPFFGVGPRRFVDVFAMNVNFLPDKMRRRPDDYNDENFLDNYGRAQDWAARTSFLRFQMPTKTHIEREVEYSNYFTQLRNAFNKYSIKQEEN